MSSLGPAAADAQLAVTDRLQRPSLARVQAHAACRGIDIGVFFPDREELSAEAYSRVVAQAKAVCSGCPVRIECGEYALTRPEEFGVWGGMNEEERADERRGVMSRRSRAARRTAA